MGFLIFLLVFVAIIVLSSIKQVEEYERGILFSFGKFRAMAALRR